MPDPNSKADLGARVKELRLNPDAIEEVRLHVPGRSTPVIVPNMDGKRMSLQILAAATNRDGYVTPSSAKSALMTYGEEYRLDAAAKPGTHEVIDLMEQLAQRGKDWRVDVIRRNKFKPIPEHVRAAIGELRGKHDSFFVYDTDAIPETAQEFNQAFSWVPKGFMNFFAVKACPNPFILELLHSSNSGLDCSSVPELTLGQETRFYGHRKIFTSNNTSRAEFRRALQTGAVINLDDITFIGKLEKIAEESGMPFPTTLCFRYNPGPLREGGDIIGNPEEAKYGLTTDQVMDAYRRAKSLGVRNFGLHTMIVSNMLREQYLIETGQMLFELAARISKEVGINFSFIDIGGGVGVPYRPEQIKVDLSKVSQGLKEAYQTAGFSLNQHSPRVVMECGRAITGPHGWLVTNVRHLMEKYRKFAGVDSSINNLLRAGIYSSSYHHITAFGKEHQTPTQVYDVVGSLCEGNDKLGINRALPQLHEGDTLVIHDAGAHGSAMRNRYNARLGCAAFGVSEKTGLVMIERAETERDLFATFKFPGSRFSYLA